MALMTWSDAYSVHDREIDDQHKQWIVLMNRLHEAMTAGHGRDVLGSILDGLVTYVRVHFTNEERLMRLHHYPQYAEHKAIHDAFVIHVAGLQQKYLNGDVLMSIEVMNTLRDWLINHILAKDKLYAPYIK